MLEVIIATGTEKITVSTPLRAHF